jgi:4a-hydroxytetrahydrobiopterin dehydratase
MRDIVLLCCPYVAILATVQLPSGYALVEGALQREFEFRDFAEALAFVNRVGELAERENHHPDIEIHWNKVTLRWWTHVSDAVTERDYELAAASNELVV